MPGPTQEFRTIMYSVEENGNVVVHKLPFNGNEKYGMEKLQRLVNRGFTFADPRIPGLVKKWRKMNAQERKAYQEAKKGGG